MGDLFWLSDEAWAAIEPHLPKNQPGARRVDDRRVISGIVHVLKSGCRCQALVEAGWIDATVAIDSTYVKAHRSAHGGKGGRRPRPLDYRVAVRPQKSMS